MSILDHRQSERSVVPRVEVRSFDQLGPGEIEEWKRVQERSAALESPFFRPEYIALLSEISPNIQVGVIREKEAPVGFFPFHEIRAGVAVPPGDCLSGLHGLIAAERGAGVDPGELLERLGLHSWSFSHLAPGQALFEPFVFEYQESPSLVVDEGFDAYLERRSDRGHTNRNILNAERKARSLARREGRIRLEMDIRDPELVARLVSWKRLQMKLTHRRDLFIGCPWARSFLDRSLALKGDDFRGQLSTLFVDDRPVAALFGLRSRRVLHGLFLGFDRELARFSPGILLLVEIARRMNEVGLTQLNLGKGSEFYKQTLKSDSPVVGVGRWSRSPLIGRLHRGRYRMRVGLARSAAGPALRGAWGGLQRTADRLLRRSEGASSVAWPIKARGEGN